MKEINKGISLILINNYKGEFLHNIISNKIVSQERELNEAIYGNKPMINPSKRPNDRDRFYIDLSDLEFKNFINKYYKLNIRQKIIISFKEKFPRFLVLLFRNIIHIISYIKNGNKTI